MWLVLQYFLFSVEQNVDILRNLQFTLNRKCCFLNSNDTPARYMNHLHTEYVRKLHSSFNTENSNYGEVVGYTGSARTLQRVVYSRKEHQFRPPIINDDIRPHLHQIAG
jgi:hypothetical protein